jgi:hypothetical protein
VFDSVSVADGQTVNRTVPEEVVRVIKQGNGTAVFDTNGPLKGDTIVEAGEFIALNRNVVGVGQLELQANARLTLRIGSDTVAVASIRLSDTCRVDLGRGALSVSASTYTESDIRAKLLAGRGDGTWNGASGFTSASVGNNRAIGYRISGNALRVAYAAPGDSNLDGVLDILDLSEILSAGKFNTGASANWAQGDTNYDGVFDIVDLADILGTGLFNEGSYLTQPAASSAAAGTVATFDQALVFAALAMETGEQPVVKRKSF